MSGATTATALTVGAAALGGAVLAQTLAPKPKIPPAAAAATTPEQPPLPAAASATAKTPTMPQFRKQNAVAEGANSTLLTGPEGVSNDLLNLGKNTLLGA